MNDENGKVRFDIEVNKELLLVSDEELKTGEVSVSVRMTPEEAAAFGQRIHELQKARERGQLGKCEYCWKKGYKTHWDKAAKKSIVVCASCARGAAPPAKKAPTQSRNEQCACGSGKKFKHCCMRKKPPKFTASPKQL